ncbi:MAG: hypothetical protein ABSH50_19490 [Bryobacteraceae bacterium]|jgi:hypothetical protein
MIQALQQAFQPLEVQSSRTSAENDLRFAELFGTAADRSTAQAAAPADSSGQVLGSPDVQSWLNSFYAQQAKLNLPGDQAMGLSATTPWEPAAGAGDLYTPDTMYGPDQVYTQALANQVGNQFATLTGTNAADLTSQLPGVPSQQAQNAFDSWLAQSNAQRLASGQPIDTSAYWSDPGPVTLNGTTYTSAQLGYCGPGQSSGPEPIYIASNNQVGPDTFTVPGYSGTVKGIQPNQYYTLQQLEKAGLQTGQPDAQYHPGSWSDTTSA